MENEDLKKAFDFDLNIDFNERKYSKEVLKFVKNYSKKSGLEKLDFIEKKSKNFNPERFFDLINEIENAFKKNEKEIDLQDIELNKSPEYGEKQIKERGEIQKNRDTLRLAKDSWKINLNEYFKKFHLQNNSSITISASEESTETIKQKSNKDKTTENPFPTIFTGETNSAFMLFIKFIENDIADPFTDYSYIFQKMKEDGLIADIKHKTFYNWLFTHNHIIKKDFDKFEINGGFKTLNKSHSTKRLNKYLRLKEVLFSIISD